jgi:hypothetical protein
LLCRTEFAESGHMRHTKRFRNGHMIPNSKVLLQRTDGRFQR